MTINDPKESAQVAIGIALLAWDSSRGDTEAAAALGDNLQRMAKAHELLPVLLSMGGLLGGLMSKLADDGNPRSVANDLREIIETNE